MTVAHFVSFKFPAGTSQDVIENLTKEFKQLKTTCVKPTDVGHPAKYIVDIVGGPNISIESMGHGYHIGVVVTFASVQDRDYYVQEDPIHAQFAKKAKGLVEDAFIFDIEQ